MSDTANPLGAPSNQDETSRWLLGTPYGSGVRQRER